MRVTFSSCAPWSARVQGGVPDPRHQLACTPPCELQNPLVQPEESNQLLARELGGVHDGVRLQLARHQERRDALPRVRQGGELQVGVVCDVVTVLSVMA